MKKHPFIIIMLGLLLATGFVAQASPATAGPLDNQAERYAYQQRTYTVQYGDTLYSIAARFNVSVDSLVAANNISNRNLIYVGQVLLIPNPSAPAQTPTPVATATATTAPPTATATATTQAGTVISYTVQRGDTLYSIALRFNTTVDAIMARNNIDNPNLLFAGTVLEIVAGDKTSMPAPTTVPTALPTQAPGASGGTKWIDVDLGDQRLVAYEGNTAVFSTLISSGVPNHPTPTGTFHVYTKLYSDVMTGGYGAEYYYIPDVPYVMYFYEGGYAIHGAYWHHNFGQPMSHGCINMSVDDSAWMFNWTPMGTSITIHW